MLVKDVLIKYHKILPFPWTLRKIKKAGLSVTDFTMDFCEEIQNCVDYKSETAKATLKTLRDLGMFI